MQMADRVFKGCSCGSSWTSREAFLGADDVQLVGYQANFRELELGLILFRHRACKTTMALPAGYFSDLYGGKTFALPLTRTSACPEYCLHKEELRPCPAECECAYVREVLQIIRQWPKGKGPD